MIKPDPQAQNEPRADDKAAVKETAAELPEAWKTFDDGTPQPDWVALLRETRDGPRR